MCDQQKNATLQGSGLPSLLKSRLDAPRVVVMQKIATYVIEHLERDDSLLFRAYETYYNKTLESDARVSSPALLASAPSLPLLLTYGPAIPHAFRCPCPLAVD